MKLTIVRHAQSEGNVAENLGSPDTPLTVQGRAQARLLAERLKGKHFDVIIVSPYVRTRETAAPTLALHSKEPVIEARAAEHNFGEFHNQPYSSYREVATEQNADWKAYVPAGGESVYQLRERILELIAELREQYPGKSVVLFTHGGAIVNLLLGLFGDDVSQLPRYRHNNTGVSRIDFAADGTPTIHFLNDLSHLPDNLHSC